MAGALKALPGVGKVITAVGDYREGKVARAEGRRTAARLRVNAKQEEAYATRRAIEQRRQAGLVLSRAQAVAASQGSSGDVSVQNVMAEIAAEGEYRAALELYEGAEAARGLRAQASDAKRRGKEAYRAGRLNAVAGLLDGGSSMYETYGGAT
jgi:hypothetical protein